MIVPKGIEYNEKCGKLKEDLKEIFYGLRDFKLPFNEDKFKIPDDTDKIPVQNEYEYLDGRNVTIWLPHGLSEDTTIDKLKPVLILENVPIEKENTNNTHIMTYELQLTNKGQLNLIAEFEPGLQYKIYTLDSNDVIDGFDLTLQASSINFYTSKLEDYAAVPHTYGDYDGFSFLKGSEDGDWDGEIPLLTRAMALDNEHGFINVFSLRPNSVDDALQLATLYTNTYNFRDEDPNYQIKVPEYSEEFKLYNITYKEMLDAASGDILIERPYGNDDYETTFQEFKVTEWQVSVLKYHIENDNNIMCKILFWINHAITGKPVKDIIITIIREIKGEMVLEDEVISDKEGMAQMTMLECPNYACQIVYWMRSENNASSALFEDYEYDSPSNFGYKVKMTLAVDRTVVFPGDNLKVSGFGTSLEKDKILPYGQNPKDKIEKDLKISPDLDPESKENNLKVPIEFDPTYGTFQVTINIPEDATNGNYQMSIENAYITFVVGEPRSPTTEVTLEILQDFVQPDGIVQANVTIESLIGAVVADDEITLTWTIINSDIPVTTVTIKTDADGVATYTIDLSTLPEDSVKVDDEIKIEITYIGPTRDVTTKSASILVLMTDKKIKNILSLDMDWPGVEFGTSASVYKRTEDVKLDDDVSVDLIYIDDLIFESDSVILDYLNQGSLDDVYGELIDTCILKSSNFLIII